MPERTAAATETQVPVPGIKFLYSSLAALFVLRSISLVEMARVCKMKPSFCYEGSNRSVVGRPWNRFAINSEIAITLKA